MRYTPIGAPLACNGLDGCAGFETAASIWAIESQADASRFEGVAGRRIQPKPMRALLL
jgi:hypothetical protein